MVGHKNDEPGITAPNVYQFAARDFEGNVVQMRKYRGHVLLIVNVASRSGFADLNYKELQKLYKVYKDRKFSVLAFPSSQLGNQEPDETGTIYERIREKGCEFDVFEKIDVNGPTTPLLWRYLKTTCGKDSVNGNYIKWNFTKFLVNRKGIPVERYGPAVPPSKLTKTIEYLLGVDPNALPAPSWESLKMMNNYVDL